MLEMLDAFIGLMFVYLILSLIVTTAMEFWVQLRGLRGKNLHQTLARLFLDDASKTQEGSQEQDLLEDFYAHSRIQALKSADDNLRSYIPREIFIEVLMDLITRRVAKRDTASFTQFRHSPYKIEQILDRFERLEREGRYTKLAQTLKTFWVEAGADLNAFQHNLDTWFVQTQERASGWFKRMVTVRLFILGLSLAVLTNADTLHMFKILTADDTLRSEYVRKALDASALDDFSVLTQAKCRQADDAAALACSQLAMVKQAAAEITPLLGWNETTLRHFQNLEILALIDIFIGWLLTAVALSLGAPFWFDMLQKVVRMRSSLKPSNDSEVSISASVSSDGTQIMTSQQAQVFNEEDFSQFQPQANHYQLINAFWMTRLAELAYDDPRIIQARCQGWALETESYSVNANKVDTQYFFAYNRDTLVLCFRGTEASNLADLQTDADFKLSPCSWAGDLQVHSGFQRALDAAWPELRARLANLHKNRYLWICGHSLGGALAMLAAHRLIRERKEMPALKIGGLYTSGQPRCGNRRFAEELERALGDRICRIVNNRDAVTMVPPPLEYAHAGTTLYITETGSLMLDPPFWYRVLDKVEVVTDKSKLARSLQETIGDHSISLYVRLLASALKQPT
jgi:hypothetical protein